MAVTGMHGCGVLRAADTCGLVLVVQSPNGTIFFIGT
jgi:hypothetical protein